METIPVHSAFCLPLNCKLIIYGAGSRGEELWHYVKKYRPDIVDVVFLDSYRDGWLHETPIVRYTEDALKNMLSEGYVVAIASHADQEIAATLSFVERLWIYRTESKAIYQYADAYENMCATFKTGADLSDRKEAFRNNVRDICLEISNYCNRSCTYCPVSLHSIRKSEVLMPLSLMRKVLTELAELDFRGSFCLNIYNEPIANTPHLFDTLSLIKSILPQSMVYFSTNGDYLNDHDLLWKMFAAGLDRLQISFHLGEFRALRSANKILAKAVALGITPSFTINSDRVTRAEWRDGAKSVNLDAVDYSAVGMNRGEILKNIPAPEDRITPCMRIFQQVAISHDGVVLPCCNFFPEDPRHRKFICGNAKDSSLVDLYFSKIFTSYRRHALHFGKKYYPCRTCSNANFKVTPEEVGNIRELLTRQPSEPSGVPADRQSHFRP